MKPIAYRIQVAPTLADAIERLQQDDLAKVVGGGQSLGAMLNLRLAQPASLVDVARIPDMLGHRVVDEELVLGAMTTHAAIEDGVVPDVTLGMLPHVAHGIAYRAVRNSGTIGGSLCHADPAADWVTAMAALDATLEIEGPAGRRTAPATGFLVSAFEPRLEPAELLVQVRIPALGRGARWSYRKFCRKTGEFALAIVAAVHDPARGVERLVLGALDGPPLVFERAGLFADLASIAAREDILKHPELAQDDLRRALHGDLLAAVVHDIKGNP